MRIGFSASLIEKGNSNSVVSMRRDYRDCKKTLAAKEPIRYRHIAVPNGLTAQLPFDIRDHVHFLIAKHFLARC